MRGVPRSLRLRLLLGGALWIAVALVISWLFIVNSFASLLESERRDDLQASLDRVVSTIDADSADPLSQGPLSDPRYDTPFSGVYWQVEDLENGELIRSRSLWDVELPPGAVGNGHPVLQTQVLPDGPAVIVLTQTIRIARNDGTERRFQVSVAEERGSTDNPVMRFGATLAMFLIALAATLLIAAVIQVQVGLRPLTILRHNIDAVRRGDVDRVPEGSATELAPVARQINELLEAQEETINLGRERAADLAHGLKTPLAVLGATSERLHEAGDRANAETLRLLADDMNERIDYQLRVARLRFRTNAKGISASVNEALLRSIAVLRKVRNGERINWIISLEEGLDADIDAHDLMELIGIILENAERWARTRISVRGVVIGDEIEIHVEDDGDGLTETQIAQLGRRGVRLDERGSGHGMGLAIAFEIARINHGTIALGRSRLGGLAVTVRLKAGGRASQATSSPGHQA